VTEGQLTLSFAAELLDQAERDRARDDLDHPFAVAAGAGAGKTETLIARLRHVLETGADPAGVVAITFTERAARDLVDKLRSKLPAALVPSIDQMTVGTIHAFCLSILRRHPLEAGLPPVFSTQDELRAGTGSSERATRVRHRFFEQVAELDDPLLREAIDVLVASNSVYFFDQLVSLVDQQWDRFADAQIPRPVGWRDTAASVAARLTELAGDGSCPPKLREPIGEIAIAMQRFAAAATMAEAREDAPDIRLGSLGGSDGKPFRDDVKALVGQAMAAVHHDALVRVLEVLVPLVLDEARDRYQAGNVSFDDILVLTRRLLTHHPRILDGLRRDISHLCVDEFQDTDAVQYDIVVALTQPSPDGTAGPVLFAVGDPKQSIYAFREADVTLFERLRAQPDITPLQLSTNFRSRPEVLRFVNTAFRTWFGADEGKGQVPFSPLEAHVPDGPSWATTIGGVIDGSADEVGRRQATDIARVVATAVGSWPCRVDDAVRPARHADIAVLVRTRADLVHLEPAFRRAGIPYVVEGGALLYDTREVRDLLRVLMAINDSASAITVVNALRTSVLAVSDLELVAHRRAGGHWNPFVADEQPAGHPAVLQALTWLRGWAASRHRVPAPELIAHVAQQSRSRAASMSDGAHITTWRRLRLVLDEARWWFEQTGGSLGEYLRWIAVRVENDDRSNVTTDETDDDAVHVLTIHAAKGLEFPIVVAAGLGRQRPSGELVRARFADSPDGATVSVKVGKLATLDWDSSGDSLQAELEAARLAYVACTRAQDHVVVCLHRAGGRGRNSAGEMDVHLDESHRTPLELVEPELSPPDAVTELDPHVDHPDPRPIEWTVRSSWSATSLRQRRDEASTAVAEAPLVPDATAPVDDEMVAPAEGGLEPIDGPGASVHAKHARAFAALPDQIGRYGTRIGRAVHGALQVVDLNDPHAGLGELIDRQCTSEAVPDRFRPYVVRLVESVLASEVFARLRRAAEVGTVRREMYVGAEVLGPDSGPIGIYGIIDAIWMEDGRFVVVDFKTDHVLETPEVLVDRYRVQLQAYEQALRAATGRDVAELLLCVALPDGSPAATVSIPGSAQLAHLST
jgi:ATP-dependent exoDNAse (exonuclease V) beta subunit